MKLKCVQTAGQTVKQLTSHAPSRAIDHEADIDNASMLEVHESAKSCWGRKHFQ